MYIKYAIHCVKWVIFTSFVLKSAKNNLCKKNEDTYIYGHREDI